MNLDIVTTEEPGVRDGECAFQYQCTEADRCDDSDGPSSVECFERAADGREQLDESIVNSRNIEPAERQKRPHRSQAVTNHHKDGRCHQGVADRSCADALSSDLERTASGTDDDQDDEEENGQKCVNGPDQDSARHDRKLDQAKKEDDDRQNVPRTRRTGLKRT
jgi:hypothetical protein